MAKKLVMPAAPRTNLTSSGQAMCLNNKRRFAMAALDWSQCPVVESVPGRCSGAWVFRATRMPVATVFENLEAVASVGEIVEQFHATPEEARTVPEFRARGLAPPPLG